MKRYAFVDVDMTLVDGNLGAIFAREVLRSGPRRVYVKNPLRFVLFLLKSVYMAILYPFAFLYPVYLFLQDATTNRFFDLIDSIRSDELERAARCSAEKARLPPEATRFLEALHERGYEIVLISASPSIVLKYLVERLPVPVRYVGIDGAHKDPMFPWVKARIIRNEFSDGVPAIVVGNPRREPFWLAKEKSIVVKRPQDLINHII